MEVRDAETGEWLVIPSPHAKPHGSAIASPEQRAKPPSVLPPLVHSPQRHDSQRPSNNEEQGRAATTVTHVVFPETQSIRPMGASVDWQREQQARVERAENRFQTSIRGLRSELQRKDLDRDARQAVEVQILEKMKAQYADQVRVMVVEEMEREVAREVEVRLEQSTLGKERLRKKHERDRAFYKAQIERVRRECELSLVASMAQYNLLR